MQIDIRSHTLTDGSKVYDVVLLRDVPGVGPEAFPIYSTGEDEAVELAADLRNLLRAKSAELEVEFA